MFLPMIIFSGFTMEKTFQRFFIESFPVTWGKNIIGHVTISEIMLVIIIAISSLILVPYLTERLEVRNNELTHSKFLEMARVIKINEIVRIAYGHCLGQHVLEFRTNNEAMQIIGADFYNKTDLGKLIMEILSKNKNVGLADCEELLAKN